MNPENLYNSRMYDFETVETFAKRVYETAKRYRKSLIFTDVESYHVLKILAKYYKEEVSDILAAIRYIELNRPSKVYLIQWVKCLDKHYLMIDKR